jgi:hypothetical protein
MMTRRQEDGWIEWGGGDCPVAAGATVQLRMRLTPDVVDETSSPEDMRWTHNKSAWLFGGGDITAYRVVGDA